MISIPFSFLPVKVLKKYSKLFSGIASNIEPGYAFLKMNLKQSGIDIDSKEYLSMCLFSTFLFFLFILFILELFLFRLGVEHPVITGLIAAFVISILVFLQQIAYPKLFVNKKIKNIEQNIIPALQDLLVQLNSGVPLFNILVNISNGGYGKLSEEFKTVVKKINTGTPQVEALEQMVSDNPSLLFRRAIWQVINGMKSGSDMTGVIQEILDSLSEEQVIQIQRYGSQLNPLAMFYMLVVIIIPSLGVTFTIIVSSFISLPEGTTKMIFYFLFGVVALFQIAFLGIIKSRRPNLLT